MPKPTVVIDYASCDPSHCEGGICQAVAACPRKLIKQEAPYEKPDYYPNMCQGCSTCVQACPTRAIKLI